MRPPLLAASILVWGALALACAGGTDPVPVPPAASAPSPVAPVAVAPAPEAGIRPLYYDRALTPADLDGRTLRELSLMRNTIFARTGQPFVKPWLDAYFRAQPWYQPGVVQDLSRLSAADRANVPLITAAEAAFTREQLVAARTRIQSSPAPTAADAVELGLISAALGEWSGSADVPRDARNPLEDPTVLEGQLTVTQIEGLSRRDLRLLRNTVYARHGRPFQSVVLQQYFFDKAWYEERADYADAMLTEVDKRNIALVQSMEDRLGGPMKEWEHQKEEGWFEGA